MTITGEQVKAARELLGWTLLDLGYRAGVSEATVAAFEGAQRTIRPDNMQAIQRALEAAGIEFDENGPSVTLRKPKWPSPPHNSKQPAYFSDELNPNLLAKPG